MFTESLNIHILLQPLLAILQDMLPDTVPKAFLNATTGNPTLSHHIQMYFWNCGKLKCGAPENQIAPQENGMPHKDFRFPEPPKLARAHFPLAPRKSPQKGEEKGSVSAHPGPTRPAHGQKCKVTTNEHYSSHIGKFAGGGPHARLLGLKGKKRSKTMQLRKQSEQETQETPVCK